MEWCTRIMPRGFKGPPPFHCRQVSMGGSRIGERWKTNSVFGSSNTFLSSSPFPFPFVFAEFFRSGDKTLFLSSSSSSSSMFLVKRDCHPSPLPTRDAQKSLFVVPPFHNYQNTEDRVFTNHEPPTREFIHSHRDSPDLYLQRFLQHLDYGLCKARIINVRRTPSRRCNSHPKMYRYPEVTNWVACELWLNLEQVLLFLCFQCMKDMSLVHGPMLNDSSLYFLPSHTSNNCDWI